MGDRKKITEEQRHAILWLLYVVLLLVGLFVWLGDDDLPNGLCGDRNDYEPHVHDSTSLGTFWCTADQTDRLPWSREKELQEMVDYE